MATPLAPYSAAAVLEKINLALDAGRKVLIGTHMRAWPITAKTRERFAKSGFPILTVTGNDLYLQDGKRRICVSQCGITVTVPQ